MNKDEVLYDLLEEIKGTIGYYGGASEEDFHQHVKAVKETFGFDFEAYEAKERARREEESRNQPVDRDNTIHRIKPNY